MPTVKVNLLGIHELDFLTGVTSASISSPGVVSINIAGLPSRSNVVLTTGTLAPSASETGAFTFGKSFSIQQVQVNDLARIRIYSTASQRDADASRPIGTAPPPNTAHGVIGEWVLNATVGLTFICSPEVLGGNVDVPATTNLYYNVTNMSTNTEAIVVTFTCLIMET